ncbi:hypothetical protein A3K86_06210 [Photobacterium jeanii]|uniref:Chromosome partitioning protein ParA n=1 Tax=Photobacterium jeanii TaxID=858640 RepID=A0A178KMH7_9GAMM|nr:hypothetical protein [Photobacterium jeanii]OAN18477.1 hypothetical protein A3K86_06210 [Photobacterium jeanii]PST91841.1 hypothetical protein C9I91_01260 [Photobacterium jeanii]
MVSINRLPPSINPQPKPRVSKTPTSRPATEPTPVSKAVTQSVRSADHAALLQEAHSHIQYDQPDGKHREAVDSYLDVMHHNKREALSAMIGVDVYA